MRAAQVTGESLDLRRTRIGIGDSAAFEAGLELRLHVPRQPAAGGFPRGEKRRAMRRVSAIDGVTDAMREAGFRS